MIEYRVFDISASGHRVALHEGRDVFHVALAPLDGVPIHHRVCGEQAALGLRTLFDRDAHKRVDLLFEHTHCTLWEALERLELD